MNRFLYILGFTKDIFAPKWSIIGFLSVDPLLPCVSLHEVVSGDEWLMNLKSVMQDLQQMALLTLETTTIDAVLKVERDRLFLYLQPNITI
jgi:hypothetical protein